MESILYPLAGGVLIGVATTVMLGGIGRIAGVSGILGASLARPGREHYWRYAFLIGLIGGGFLISWLSPQSMAVSFNFNYPIVILAGLLVGLGTRLGSGCTSGHGVCGMPRLSKRSIVATSTFIAFGILTVLAQKVFL